MSSNVKQANFRLPLAYMDLIDEISKREGLTKAAVITRALDCLKASYDSGNGGDPVASGATSAASSGELDDLKNRLQAAENRAQSAESRLQAAESRAEAAEGRVASAEQARDAAERRASEAASARDAAESRARTTAADLEDAQRRAASAAAAPAVSTEEVSRLKSLVAAGDAKLAQREAAIAERDARIATLSEKLNAANAQAEMALKNINVEAVPISDTTAVEDDPTRALAMLNMIGGVMNAFQQQVDDARVIGEQEGRMAVQRELQDMVEKARNDGYRDAMGYLDDRVTTARDNGAREERARIANMSFFERRRYLRMHIA